MNRYLVSTWPVVMLLAGAAAVAAPQYTLVDLGSLDVGGQALLWQLRESRPAPPDFPSLPGASAADPPFVYYFNLVEEVAVGWSTTSTGAPHGVKWVFHHDAPPTLTDVGVLPGAAPSASGPPESFALGFNTVGDVVGFSDSPYNRAGFAPGQPAAHGFLWNSGVMTDLGSIAGPGYVSVAKAVNDSHEVVGMTETISNTTGGVLDRAFMYANGTMYNLSFYLVGSPAVRLTDALWIDCQGNIAATGTPATGGPGHNYLLLRQGTPRTCSK